MESFTIREQWLSFISLRTSASTDHVHGSSSIIPLPIVLLITRFIKYSRVFSLLLSPLPDFLIQDFIWYSFICHSNCMLIPSQACFFESLQNAPVNLHYSYFPNFIFVYISLLDFRTERLLNSISEIIRLSVNCLQIIYNVNNIVTSDGKQSDLLLIITTVINMFTNMTLDN